MNYSFTFCDEVHVFRFDSSKFDALGDTILTQASRAHMVIGYFLHFEILPIDSILKYLQKIVVIYWRNVHLISL